MSIQQLKEKLKKGFYEDNLNEMARICRAMALDNINPAPFFIMQKIFSGIADYWDDSPVIVEEAKLVESGLITKISEIINAIENESPPENMMSLMNQAISSYLFFVR